MLTGGIPTVHFTYRTSGKKSAEMLIEQLEHPGELPVSTIMGYRVVAL